MMSLNPLLRKGQIAELRAPKLRYGTASGYFNDPAKLLIAAQTLDGTVPGLYVTLNPVKEALLARADNRIEPRAALTTADADILRRDWLLIDVDPVRPSGISSTDAEHAAALARIADVRDWLSARGWPEPVEADSGNGAHLLYSIALPNDDASRTLLMYLLEVLALQFNDAIVTIDTGVYNAARITKLYGTLACKGDSMPDRPHRRSRVLVMPWPIIPVPPDTMQALAALRPTEAKLTFAPAGGGFDLAAWMQRHTLEISRQKMWNGATVHELQVCPFNAEHARSARIIQFPNGGLAFGCFHNSCQAYDWRLLRDRLDGPGWRPNHMQGVIAPSAQSRSVRLEQAETVIPKNPRFLVRQCVPIGEVTILVGMPGQGKTTLAMNLLAQLSRGVLTGDLFGEPCTGLVLTAEDAVDYTLVPRLMAANADLTRVSFVQISQDDLITGFNIPDDLDALAGPMHDRRARLLIIDPFVAHLPERLNAHRDQDIRRAMAPLVRFAKEHDAAILCIAHFNKQQCDDILARVGGSIGFVAAARSVLFAGDDPDREGAHLLVHAKSNLGPLVPTQRYAIESRTVQRASAVFTSSGIAWLGEVAGVTADAIMARVDAKERQDRHDVVTWLKEFLQDGEHPHEEIKNEAATLGFTPKMLWRARTKLKIVARKIGFEAGWAWSLPPEPSGGCEDSHTEEKGIFDQNHDLNPCSMRRFPEDSHAPRKGAFEDSHDLSKTPARFPEDSPKGAFEQSSTISTTYNNHNAEDSLPPGNTRARGSQTPTPCPACRELRFWKSIHGALVCGTCHPPTREDLVEAWIEGGDD